MFRARWEGGCGKVDKPDVDLPAKNAVTSVDGSRWESSLSTFPQGCELYIFALLAARMMSTPPMRAMPAMVMVGASSGRSR